MTTTKTSPEIAIGDHTIGANHDVFVVAEIGINHNGSVDDVKKLVDGAVWAGCQAVKFQKRTPERCVPRDQWDRMRETPWGHMRYIDYRHKVEFNKDEYAEIDGYCKSKNILWFTSCWDEEAVTFTEQFNPPCYKVASASVTDLPLLKKLAATGRPMILSTGMSTLEQIDQAVETLGRDNLLICHATSTYPCPVSQLNLNVISTLRERYPECPIGYSGHEIGLSTTWAAVALGACFVERHITLDRAMWGSDQAASVEIPGMHRLVSNIHDIYTALGDGVKCVYPEEAAAAAKLRRVRD